MSDGSGRVMRTDLADLGITMVEKTDELPLSVPIKLCEGDISYVFEFCRHDGPTTS